MGGVEIEKNGHELNNTRLNSIKMLLNINAENKPKL